jgi:hypothetical protein
MVKYIVSTGCSFTDHGFELENWDTRDPKFNTPEVVNEEGKQIYFTSYGKELAELLGAEYIHLAQCGSGIDYSIQTLWKWIQDNPDKKDDCILLFGISLFQRQDILIRYDEQGKQQRVNFPNPRVLLKKKDKYEWEEVAEMFKWPLERFKDFVKFFWEFAFDWDLNRTQRLTGLTTFEAYCKINNIPLVFISTINKDNVKEHLDLFYFPTGHWSWREYIHSYDSNYNSGHPNTYDHKLLASHLYDYVKAKFKKS